MHCKLERDGLPKIVGGLDLQGGLPPDQPQNIYCETSRTSDLINCSWNRGQETHIPNTYNISVSRENGAHIYSDQIQNVEEFTVPKTILDENTKYQIFITAYNYFGASKSDPFILCTKDVVIPDTPRIMRIEFWNNSLAAMLYWKSPESSTHLRTNIRLSTDNDSWEVREGTELSKDLIRVDGLKALMEYAFQMRTCNATSGLMYTSISSSTPTLPSSKKALCSKWSPSVRRRSPGKGPSQQLHVWRVLGIQETNGMQTVTVLWKPPPPEDYSGEVQQYNIFLDNDQKQEVTCAGDLSQCVVQVPPGVQTLSVSVVTSYGKSPPADVPIRYSGVFGPVLGELAPAGNGSAVFVAWSWPGAESGGEQLLHYMIEWRSGSAGLHWQRVDKDQNRTSITGLTAGVRYNMSLYAVTTSGVTAPSSRLVYSKEQKPVCGPNLSVLVHEDRRILIQWDELAEDQQKGFITNYTIYIQTSDSSQHRVMVSGSAPRLMWLDCPAGALALHVTASTSVGEGPGGTRVSSQPAVPAVGLVIIVLFIIMFFIAIIANLMCWSCVRKRIKQKCISLGPACLSENLPEVENSKAIQHLEQEDGASETLYDFTQSDPPLSPIKVISQEETEDVYPTIHTERVQVKPDHPTDCGMVLLDSLLEHVGYKPQISRLAPKLEEEEKVKESEGEQRDVPASDEEECLSISGGLLRGLLCNLEVDFCNSSPGWTLGSGLLLPKTLDTSNVFSRDACFAERRTESEMEAGSSSLDLQQGEIMTPLSHHVTNLTLTTGYFPQIAAANSTAI
ncbi:hypothetical protein LDENG_00149560 [Lucifuga dentata]|nr:hypothetical protein LDENG_00149560 [Lucifuga dentata]